MDHEHFKELTALAAGGLLSGEEHSELAKHLAACSSCRQELAEFEGILFDEFPLTDLEKGSHEVVGKTRDYKGRFLARAREEGIPLPNELPRTEAFWERVQQFLASVPSMAYGAAAVALVVLVGTLGVMLREARRGEVAQAGEIQSLQEQAAIAQERNASLENRVEELSSANTANAVVEGRLSNAEAQNSALAARYASLEKELQAASARVDELQAENQAGIQREQSLSAKLKDTEASLVNVRDDLQSLRKAQATDTASTNERVTHAKELESRLTDANDTLERAKRLLAADRDIRDLMGARSLHITDVYDVDPKGRTKRPFGRVFYTENKSLIFYAFDLNKEKNASAERSFQVWGYQEAALKSAQSLGILFRDDEKQNRWVLKFDDPSVLAAIDAVFVTAEPPGGSEKPTGQKLLYAYLSSKPNHP